MRRRTKPIPLITLADTVPSEFTIAKGRRLQFMAAGEFGNRFRYQDEVVIEGFAEYGYGDGLATFGTAYHLPDGQCIVSFERD